MWKPTDPETWSNMELYFTFTSLALFFVPSKTNYTERTTANDLTEKENL